ncbi:chloride channel [Dipodascopsis tothii]|uniref:chloride channel n=1 Tax=Dipodascopsis tothii TaxID=44089 RepID=UPI0034CE0919
MADSDDGAGSARTLSRVSSETYALAALERAQSPRRGHDQPSVAPPTVRFDLHSPGITPRLPRHGHHDHHDEWDFGADKAASAASSVRSGRSGLSSVGSLSPASRSPDVAPEGPPVWPEPDDEPAPARYWYDDFTTIDWMHDYIKESFRVRYLHGLRGFRGRLARGRDAAQGWILICLIGSVVAGIAFLIDTSEQHLFDWRSGYCTTNLLASERFCCGIDHQDDCAAWRPWRDQFGHWSLEYAYLIAYSLLLALAAVGLTLTTRTTTPFSKHSETARSFNSGDVLSHDVRDRNVIYSAAGGGVAEVKTILSGFVIKKFLGWYTLVIKSVALVLSICSGLNVGKEGPYVHMAACVGNICCRMFTKFNHNDGKRREVLSAAASAGVAVAFGSPLGGVLFSLEEVSYYFPPKTLFRSFLCAVISALVLRLLNPYGTGKIVIFEVSYDHDWHAFEFVFFVLIGACGGIFGALFSRLNIWWTATWRSLRPIEQHPALDVAVLAAATAAVSYFNVHTRKGAAELLYDLASPCPHMSEPRTADMAELEAVCPAYEDVPRAAASLAAALCIKFTLTALTAGAKVPAGVYVPSMVSGALFGRIVGLAVQWLQYSAPHLFLFSACGPDVDPRECTIAGVYAIVGAGAFMAGITRMTVTLAVILFELTGSLDHVLPISIAILISRWVAHALEPVSLFDHSMAVNGFPFLDNQSTPGFADTLQQVVPRTARTAASPVIDITESNYLSARVLRTKLHGLQLSGELDGSLPIIRKGILVGLLPAPELEYALDHIKERAAAAGEYGEYTSVADLPDSDVIMCHLSVDELEIHRYYHDRREHGPADPPPTVPAPGRRRSVHTATRADREARAALDEDDAVGSLADSTGSLPAAEATDLTPFIDRAPICLDINAPVAMAHMIFVKLGLRIICVADEGRFWGVLHKKKFVDYCKFNEQPTKSGPWL